MIKHIFMISLLIFTCPSLSAQSIKAEVYGAETKDFPKIEPLSWLNHNFLDKQRGLIDQLTRTNFGQQLKSNKTDLALLQRLIDAKVIPRDDKESLQALGVVFGDVFAAERNELAWQIYEDELARSHAVCVTNTKHCLFPITMLSRRIEAGISPTVDQIFNKGLAELKPFLPKRPYLD